MIRPLPLKSGKPWPWNALPKPRPADWGIGMTICIAAHCFREKCIVLASDFMVARGDMSADMAAFKQQSVGSHWMAEFAGDDISLVTPIIRSVRRSLRGKTDLLEDITAAFVQAYGEQLQLKTENEILRPIGYTHQEFKESGLSQLGAETFSRIFYEIQQQHIELDFLIAGFDQKDPFIFTVTSRVRLRITPKLHFGQLEAVRLSLAHDMSG